jgi:hypothetical protein
MRLSKQIDRKCGLNPNRKGLTFHDLRRMLYNEGKLNLFDQKLDTLYVLQSYSIHDEIYRSIIWNRKERVQYVYGQVGFKFDQQKIFTDYTIRLIQNWDTLAIRNEESLYSNYLPVYYIRGIRIIRGKKDIIECVKFKEFINPKRD